MTKTDKENTEEKILNAAKKVFVTKGSDGARMQEIADEAGINKSLLHYYYRSKEKLFGAVFKFAFQKFAPNLMGVFESDQDIFTKITTFIHGYIDIINKNPFIPLFIINEVNKKNAGFVGVVIKNSGINIDLFEEEIKREIKKGTIKQVDHRQLIVNTLALCVFPFIGRPIIQKVVFEDNESDYDDFLKLRKEEVSNMIINSITLTEGFNK